jgi:redox-sensitive bicupin YhaK (pirin superfamily)
MVLTDGDLLMVSASDAAARGFLVSARPLNEPILQYRSLVMNTVEDIQESVAMIEAGSFARVGEL